MSRSEPVELPPYTRVAVVTGANKGIGLAIIRQLIIHYPTSSMNRNPPGQLKIYLCSRDRARGMEALLSLVKNPSPEQIEVSSKFPQLIQVTLPEDHCLDIADPASVAGFVDYVKECHPEGIDILINNAGLAMTGFDLSVVKSTFACNYYGTLDLTQKFLPLMREGGRVVNVASGAGHLGPKYSAEIKDRFRRAQTVQDVSRLMEEFTEAVAEGGYEEKGWPGAAYAVSKAGVIGFTRIMAREERKKGKGVLVNVCCPGYVRTDMTRGAGAKTPDQGAQTPVMLAVEDIGGTTGEFWQHEKVIQW